MPVARPVLILLTLTASSLALSAQDDTSSRRRPVSDNLAAALADTMPKFNPPPPEPEKKDDNEADDVDDPNNLLPRRKNGIIRLPKMVVEGVRPPVFSEREVNTDKGLAKLAVNRYFTDTTKALNKFHIPGLTSSAEELAMQMWQEDERLRLMADLKGQADTTAALGDTAEAKELKTLTNDTLGRKDFLPAASALNRQTKGN